MRCRTGHAEFTAELLVYKSGKGSVQFPLDQPLPLLLIAWIVTFRVQEDAEKRPAGRGSRRR